MPGGIQRSALHVEGDDDQHSIVHLLIRHGVDYDTKPWPAAFPKVRPSGSVEKLLEAMETGIRLSGGKAIGFVLDADFSLVNRWQAVRGRLRAVDLDAPGHPPAGGFVGTSPTYNANVGVWLMPDNQQDGKLETFLQSLIREDDPLIGHAESAADQARVLGAQFSQPDRIKAIIHGWLAWQEKPGMPYGTAICAKYFEHDSQVANAFVAWFKNLYGIST